MFIKKTNIQILCLTETKVSNEVLNLGLYDIWRKARVGKQKFGIIILTQREKNKGHSSRIKGI